MKVKLLAWLSSVALGIVIFSSCVDLPDDYLIPSWDFELNIPLKSDVYLVEDILTIDSNITIDSSAGVRAYLVTGDKYEEKFSTKEFIEGQLDFDNGELYTFPLATTDSSLIIDFRDGVEIDSANISAGTIIINMDNASDKLVTVTITIPDLVDYFDKVFEKVITIDPNEQNKQSFLSIENHIFTSPNSPIPTGELKIDINLASESSQDEVSFDLRIAGSDFKYIKAKIPSRDIDPVNESVELPMTDDAREARDILSFKNATMTLSALLSPEDNREDSFDARLYNISIIGIRNGLGQTIKVIDKTSGNQLTVKNGKLNKVYDNVNSNISEFLSFLPDEIKITADLQMNPSQGLGVATNNDEINLAFEIKTSSDIKIDSSAGFIEEIWFNEEYTTYETREEVEYTGERDTRDLVGDNGTSLELFYEVDNTIPLDVDLVFDFLGASGEYLFSETVLVEGASPDKNNGLDKSNFSGSLKFDKEKIKMFVDCWSAKVKWNPRTPGDGSEPIYFGPDQTFDFNTWLSLKILISEDLFGSDDEKKDEEGE
jgi:hypothetical protein